MEDILSCIAFIVSLCGLLIVINGKIENKEDYVIYDECYKIEEKFYCKNK